MVAGALFSVFFSTVFFSVVFFSALGSDFLVAAAAAGLASFLASFTGPDVPAQRVSSVQVERWNAMVRRVCKTRQTPGVALLATGR